MLYRILVALLLLCQAQVVCSPTAAADTYAELKRLAANIEELRLRGAYTEAEQVARSALELARQTFGENDVDTAAASSDLARILHLLNRSQEAEPLLRRALTIFDDAGTDPEYVAPVLSHLGVVVQAQGRYSEAEVIHRRALELYDSVSPRENLATASALTHLAASLQAQGRYQEAEPLLRRALTIFDGAGTDPEYVAPVWSQLGVVVQAQGRYSEAEVIHRRALEFYDSVSPPDPSATASVLSHLASSLRDQGRYTDAAALYGRARSIFEAELSDDHPAVARVLGNEAWLLLVQGRYAEAEVLATRALKIQRMILPSDSSETAETLDTLGGIFTATRKWEEAQDSLVDALRIKKTVLPLDHPEIADTIGFLAELKAIGRRYVEAQAHYEEVLRIHEASLPTDHPEIANDLRNVAWVLTWLNRWNEVNTMLERAITIWTAPRNRDRTVQQRVGFYMHAMSSLLVAEGDRQRAANLRSGAFASLQWAGTRSVSSALSQTGVRMAAGRPELAALVRRHQDGVAEAKRLDQMLLRALAQVGLLRSDAGITELRQRAEEKAQYLRSLDAELATEFPLYAELAFPAPLGSADAMALLDEDEALITLSLGEPNSILFAVSKEGSRANRQLPPGPDLASRAQRLRCTAAVTDPACGGGTGNTKSWTPRRLRAVEEDEPGSTPFDLPLAHDLYRQLLGPVEDVIRNKKHLIIVADGALAGFPFHLLVKEAPDAGLDEIEAYKRAHWLIRDHTLTVLPAVSSLRALRELAPKTAPAPLPFIGFGDPVIGNGKAVACGNAGKIVVAAANGTASIEGVVRDSAGTPSEALFRSGSVVDGLPVADVAAVRALDRLPDTRCELKAIATSQGPDSALYFDVDATESRVKALSATGQLADYRAVAFSTHGLVTGEAGAAEPALVLTPPPEGTTVDDGLLTASEVAALKLNADWVVLSACNTAAGDGRPDAESLSGLARAFFYAGARSILVSHWPVWSDAAVDITTRAFAGLQEDPSLGRAGALRQAMLDTLVAATDYRHAHPAYWAPFSLVGEGML